MSTEVSEAGSESLTICSVFCRDQWCLDLNYDLAYSINGDMLPRWIAVDNDHPEAEPSVEDRYEVVGGAKLDAEREGRYVSYHHAAALAIGTRLINTRFALFLDPDCFILRWNWVEEILAYMIDRELWFFGVPYHPAFFTKIRYFPCAVCLFVDLERVPISELDWIPEAIGSYGIPRLSLWKRGLRRLISHRMVRRRLRVGSSEDTGIRIYRRFVSDHEARHECVTPVFDASVSGVTPSEAWAERLLPDRYRLVPGKPGYFSREGFETHDFPAVRELGCEEYVWRGSPFAFHVRGTVNSLKNDRNALESLLGEMRGLCVRRNF